MSKNCKRDDSLNKNSAVPPSHLLVIAGILGGALDVNSIRVDKDQNVDISLSGTLKKKTQLEKMMDQIGQMPFDEVLKVMLDRIT